MAEMTDGVQEKEKTLLVHFDQSTRKVPIKTRPTSVDDVAEAKASCREVFADLLRQTDVFVLQQKDEDWGGEWIDVTHGQLADRSVLRAVVIKPQQTEREAHLDVQTLCDLQKECAVGSIKRSQIYGGQGRPLSSYQAAMNAAAEELCLWNPNLLWNRGVLIEEARKRVNKSGFNYKRGRSRSKRFGDVGTPELMTKRVAELPMKFQDKGQLESTDKGLPTNSMESILIPRDDRIKLRSQLFKQRDQPLSAYHSAMNKAAESLCVRKPSLLRNRALLIQEARKVVNDSGFAYKKGKSRSKNLNPVLETNLTPQGETGEGSGMSNLSTIKEEVEIRKRARLFKWCMDRPLSAYHSAMNKAAEELCLKNPNLVYQRGLLLEEARKEVNASGFIYKKGKSRSKLFNPSIEVSVCHSKPQKLVAAVQEDLADIKDRLSIKKKQRKASEMTMNYKLTEEITNELTILKSSKRDLKLQLSFLKKSLSERNKAVKDLTSTRTEGLLTRMSTVQGREVVNTYTCMDVAEAVVSSSHDQSLNDVDMTALLFGQSCPNIPPNELN